MVNSQNNNSYSLARSGPGREARPEQAHEQAREGAHACIYDIFSSSHNDNNELYEKLLISEGICKIKRDFIVAEDETFLCGGSGGCKKGLRREIRMFSSKSRRNLMIKLAQLKSPFKFWQDFTFADDTMQGLSIKERSKRSGKVLKAFKLWLEREGYKIQGVWKREWRPRISGILIGQHVPHFHILYSIEGNSEKEYFKIALLFAQKWVEFTGTENCKSALKVAEHPKSYRLIKSRKQANQYISDKKYISKNGEFISQESIGRNWGYIGTPEFSIDDVFYLNLSEMALMRRILKKFVRKNKKSFKRLIVKKYSRFFIFIEKSTVYRILEWIVKARMNRAVEGVPF